MNGAVDWRPPLFVSFSGGRTSGFMTRRILTTLSGIFRPIVVFANTGLENPRTLDFVHKCDTVFGFGTVWVEAEVDPSPGAGTKHRVVTYETASRGGEPFEAVIQKYGIPNVAFPGCTRELKLRPLHSYLRSVGVSPTTVLTAIGIRTDEARRVSANPGPIVYPLIKWFPTDKQDVLDWWEDQPFDLAIQEFEGNCRGCFKKSSAKLYKTLDADPSALDWHARMEREYPMRGAGTGPRTFFRGNRSALRVVQEHRLLRGMGRPPSPADLYADGGCAESCELFPTDGSAE